jgi:hypothetical protein
VDCEGKHLANETNQHRQAIKVALSVFFSVKDLYSWALGTEYLNNCIKCLLHFACLQITKSPFDKKLIGGYSKQS